MVVMVQFEQVTAMTLTVIGEVLDAATLARFAITYPAAIGKLVVAANDVRQNGCVRLDSRRTHTKCQRHTEHGAERPQARQERRTCGFHGAIFGAINCASQQMTPS